MSKITVKALPDDPGPAGWNSILPTATPAPKMEADLKADWLIIGAGFAGLAAAYRLRQLCPTDKIVVLEASRLAHGPSGRNSGFMIDLPHDLSSQDYGGELNKDMAETNANRQGIKLAAQIAKQFNLESEAFDLCGKINAAATPKGDQHNSDYAAHLQAMKEPHTVMSARDMQELTGTDYYTSGLFTPGSALLQPAMYIRALGSGLRDQGVEIYEENPVLSLMKTDTWIAETPNGTVSAPRVILTVNGHLNSFGYQQRRLMHIHTYASMTEELTKDQTRRLGGQSNWALTPADPMGTTVRRISGVGGDRLVVRNQFTFDPSLKISASKLQRITRRHDKSFTNRFAMLSDVKMQYRWGGRLCLSRNNVSVFGEIETGLYSACCHLGLGTAKGTFMGAKIAELATNTNGEMLDYALGQEQPARLPPRGITDIGVNAYIRWQEHKAGREF